MGVVLLQKSWGKPKHPAVQDLESIFLQPLENFSRKPLLYRIRFDQNQSCFVLFHINPPVG